ARAVATRPRALLADELASGLDVTESHQLAGVLRELAASGLAILLIEHDIELVMELSSVIYVVDFGKLIASGPPDAIASDPAVQAAYLGVDAAAVKKEGRRGATARR
ncbi:MAG TPA: ABC transporter, partial [Acidimicrobiia bacterium]|nr:ABC transporter [Acidimicrobiia bacterium]